MEFQIALNTVILIMMIVFPGFLFRKFYFAGESTKHFGEDTQFDRIVWNIFFSSVSIIITIISIYTFKSLTKLPLLESINYEALSKLLKPIKNSEIPEKQLITSMYFDLFLLVCLIYFFAAFLGIIFQWIVKVFGLDYRYPMLRANNDWFYYIRGNKKVYDDQGKRKKRMLTAIDVLCEQGNETQLYSGLLSEYSVNADTNALETLFLTNASRYKITTNADHSKTIILREIPGDSFSIPYSRVLNMNFQYVYKEDQSKDKKSLENLWNIIFLILLFSLAASLWFDLGSFGIVGFLSKLGYFSWSFVALSNLKWIADFLVQSDRTKGKYVKNISELPGQLSLLFISLLWLYYTINGFQFWIGIIITLSVFMISAESSEKLKKRIKIKNQQSEINPDDDIEII